MSSSTTTVGIAPRIDVGTRCSQPVTDGATPIASDCLFILRAAVGLGECALECVYDVNGDSNVSATDALT